MDGQPPREAARLLDRPDLAEDPRYAHKGDPVRHPAELDQILGGWCAQRDRHRRHPR